MRPAPAASDGRNGAPRSNGAHGTNGAVALARLEGEHGLDAHVLWILVLLLAPVAVGAALALTGYSWQAVVLCTFATGACVPIAIPWLARKPFDLFHPMAFVTLSVLLGTTLRSLYVCLVNSDNTHWLLENGPLDALLPGAYVLCAAT